MPNIKLDSDQTKATNLSHSSKVDPETGSYLLERYTSQECCLLANLFFSEGKPGKVMGAREGEKNGGGLREVRLQESCLLARDGEQERAIE